MFIADDVFNIIALLTLIGYFATFYISNYSLDDATHRKALVSSGMLLWSTLYSVKEDFLALMWPIFKVAAGFRKAWWAVTVYTFFTFWPAVLMSLWGCGTLSYLSGAECSIDVFYHTKSNPLIIRLALHVSSDILILILPLAQIWKMHMRLLRKIGVAAVFALVIIDIALGILRQTPSLVLNGVIQDNEAAYNINYVSCLLEPILAVIVCSLPPYRALAVKFRSKRGDLELQRDVAIIKRRWLRPRKVFSLISAYIPNPYLEISTLDERSTGTTGPRSTDEPATTCKHSPTHPSDSEIGMQTATESARFV